MVMIVVIVVSIGRTLVFTKSSATDIPICNGPPHHYCRCHYCYYYYYYYYSRQPLCGPTVSSTTIWMSLVGRLSYLLRWDGRVGHTTC